MKDKSLFRIRYDTNVSDADREDLDLAALEDVLVMGRAYEDSADSEGKT